MGQLTQEERIKLRALSTPTIATLLFKKGLRNQVTQQVVPLIKENRPWLVKHLP